jgi:hypothetical protein
MNDIELQIRVKDRVRRELRMVPLEAVFSVPDAEEDALVDQLIDACARSDGDEFLAAYRLCRAENGWIPSITFYRVVTEAHDVYLRCHAQRTPA